MIQHIEGVELVAVFGIHDEEAYDLPAAIIQKNEGYESLKEEDIIQYVAERLPEYNHLDGGVYFINKMPMTTSGKISRHVALEMTIEMYTNQQTKGNSM